MPREQLTGWLDTVAGLNPVTYILDGLRSLAPRRLAGDELAQAMLAIAAVGTVSMAMCFAALRGRVNPNAS